MTQTVTDARPRFIAHLRDGDGQTMNQIRGFNLSMVTIAARRRADAESYAIFNDAGVCVASGQTKAGQ